jgi:uncharacterized damage-inducible protein DinB
MSVSAVTVLDMTTATTTPSPNAPSSPEQADLASSLQRHRGFLLHTVSGITDDQARQRTTVSELTLGGLIKHVAQTERQWADFMVNGPGESPQIDWESVDWTNPPPEVAAYMDSHRMREDETLAELTATYAEVAAATDALIGNVDLDQDHPLPKAPWHEPGTRWTARRTLLHILAETSQHAGHADIIREALDGQKTMG